MKLSQILKFAGLNEQAEVQQLKEASAMYNELQAKQSNVVVNGFKMGDHISYTATDERPTQVYTGTIAKIEPNNTTVGVAWDREHPKSNSAYVDLHWCRKTDGSDQQLPQDNQPPQQ